MTLGSREGGGGVCVWYKNAITKDKIMISRAEREMEFEIIKIRVG
jgi:hypothetical protein